MKYLPPEHDEAFGNLPTIEMTRRNLEQLLLKLDDPNSACTILDGDHKVAVRAVQNDKHYKDENRAPGLMYTNGNMQ